MLEKQLLTIVAVIKKMQLKLKKNNISIEELTELVNKIKEYDNTDNEKSFRELVKTINSLKTLIDDNREELSLVSVSYQDRLKELSTNLELSLNGIKEGLKEFITIENINKLENDINDKIKGIKIEPQKEIEIGKVYTLDPGEEAKVEVTKTEDSYKLDFYIPRGVSGRGMPGKGVASGGTTNQVLAKNSNDDYDTKWVTGGGGGTSDHSELTNLDYASAGHTGFQPAGSYVEDASYVHTDNNFTDALETKLTGIEAGAEVNVQADWNQATNTADDYIKNKPSIPSAYVLPTASTTVLGGVKIDGSTIAINEGVISATTGGGGDVTGPTGAVADNIAVFNSTTGKIIKDGGVKISDLQPAGTYSTDIHANITALNAVSGTNTGNQVATDFDIKDLTDSTSLRTTWSGKQDALGFTPENVSNKKLDLTDNSDTYYPSQKAVKTAVDGKVTGNVVIVAGTKTKISYDTKGLVTSGADATTADIADSTNKRYVSDAQLVVIGNTSGTNSGDQTSIVGISGTKSQFDTACSDGNFLYSGDITQYTDEMAQDTVGGILTDTTTIDFTYDDATPKITADVKDASITYAKIQNVSATDRILGRDSAGAGSIEEITPANLVAMLKASIIDTLYPIGHIYETTSTNLDTTTKMATQFGGTWEAYGSGRVLVCKSADTEFDVIGETGGAKTHTLTKTELPDIDVNTKYAATAGGNGSGLVYGTTTGNSNNSLVDIINNGGGAHNNLQPYIVVYRYRRTA